MGGEIIAQIMFLEYFLPLIKNKYLIIKKKLIISTQTECANAL